MSCDGEGAHVMEGDGESAHVMEGDGKSTYCGGASNNLAFILTMLLSSM